MVPEVLSVRLSACMLRPEHWVFRVWILASRTASLRADAEIGRMALASCLGSESKSLLCYLTSCKLVGKLLLKAET